MSRTDAVESLYSDMAARHRARFRSIHVRQSVSWRKVAGMLTATLDPACCRTREDRRHSTTIHQAAHHEELEIPAAPSRTEDEHEEGLRCQAALDIRISGEAEGCFRGIGSLQVFAQHHEMSLASFSAQELRSMK
jgi:hypothetical protein